MEKIYYLGGSPCCGKSTIAEILSKKHSFQYYKADDYWDKFVSKGVINGDEWLKQISAMTIDELWLRSPQILHEYELITYEKLFPYFVADLKSLDKDIPIIAEGAAFLPYLVNQLGIDKMHYVCVVPTKDFQIKQYSKRTWVNDYLTSSSDKEKAFENWMERDALFALSVLSQAREFNYQSLVVDGSKSIDENLLFVEALFKLI